MTRDNEFIAATRELSRSALGALVGDAVDKTAIAARESRFVARATGLMLGFRSLPPAGRLCLVALSVAVAAGAHVVLETLVPPHFASSVPSWLWVITSAVAAGLAASAHRAWR